MEDKFSIQEIIQTLKKRIILILSLTLGLIAIAAVLSFYILTPMYQSSSQFIVIQKPSENIQFSINEIEKNLELINTYKEIIKSPTILKMVIAEENLPVKPEQLSKRIEVTSGENSQVVTVSAVAESPQTAAMIANLVVEKFQNTIPTIMSIENVYVLSKAALSHKPIKPNPVINMVIAGVIGLATGIAISLFLEFLNTKVKMESDVEEMGITVLGVVSVFEAKQPSKKKKKKKKRKTTSLLMEGELNDTQKEKNWASETYHY